MKPTKKANLSEANPKSSEAVRPLKDRGRQYRESGAPRKPASPALNIERRIGRLCEYLEEASQEAGVVQPRRKRGHGSSAESGQSGKSSAMTNKLNAKRNRKHH